MLIFSCSIPEAPKSKRILHVTADYLSSVDSSILIEFSKNKQIELILRVLTPNRIALAIAENKFNPDIDILLLQNDSLRQSLFEKGLFKKIKNKTLFYTIERQFNNTHHLWLPLTHNPLVVCVQKDSSEYCERKDLRSLIREHDTVPPRLFLGRFRSEILNTLAVSNTYSWMNTSKKRSAENPFSVYLLTELVEQNTKKESINQKSCNYYLVDKKRYFSIYQSASVYKYGRNTVLSELLLAHLKNQHSKIAWGRNQLSTFKNQNVGYNVLSLNIQ